MNKVFEVSQPFQVPDGTFLSPFLNSKDCMSGLPFNLLDGVSLAAGFIAPHQESKIHIMPHVTQITFVRHGILSVQMKGLKDIQPCLIQHLTSQQAIITEPKTFLQYINTSDQPCEVLYIVTPAYIYELVDGSVVYDDSLVIDESWDDLNKAGWQTAASLPTIEDRNAAEKRMSLVAKPVST